MVQGENNFDEIKARVLKRVETDPWTLVYGGAEKLDEVPVPPPPYKVFNDDPDIEYGWGVRFYAGSQDGIITAPGGYGVGISVNHSASGCDVLGYENVEAAFHAAMGYARLQLDSNKGYTFSTRCKGMEGILDIKNGNGEPVINVYMTFGRERELQFMHNNEPKSGLLEAVKDTPDYPEFPPAFDEPARPKKERELPVIDYEDDFECEMEL